MSSSNRPLRYETEISNSKSLISPLQSSYSSCSSCFPYSTGGKGKYAQPLSYTEKGVSYVLS